MKGKFTFKTLLVAAGLVAGSMSAWAVTETYDFKAWDDAITADAYFTLGSTSFTFTSSSVASGASEASDTEITTYLVASYSGTLPAGQALNSRFAFNGVSRSGNNYGWRMRNDKGGLYCQTRAQDTYPYKWMSIVGLKTNETVTITYTGTLKFQTTNVTTTVAKGDNVTSATTYTVAADGELHFQASDGCVISKIVIETVSSETCGEPSMAITAANGNSRTITITPGVGSAGSEAAYTIYTTDGSDPTFTDAENYNGTIGTTLVVSEASTTVKAISVLSDGTCSDVASATFTAGTPIKLANPTITLSGMTEVNGYYYPEYTFAAVSTGTYGSPTITLTATLNGNAISSPYTSSAAGTISVIASADGYADSEAATLDVDGTVYEKTTTYDFTQDSYREGLTVQGNNISINGTGVQVYRINTADFIDGLTLSTVDETTNFGITKAQNYDNCKGIAPRWGAGSITINDWTTGGLAILTPYVGSTLTTTTTGTFSFAGQINSNTFTTLDIYAPATNVIGALDNSTAFMGATKDQTIAKGQKVTYSFQNHGNNTQNWYNWVLGMDGTYNEADFSHQLRADNFVWETSGTNASTLSATTDGVDMNWTYFRSDMTDASVTLTAYYYDNGVLAVKAVGDGASHKFDHWFAFDNAQSGDIDLKLGVDHSWLEVNSVTTATATVDVTIGTAGWATLYTPTAVSFEDSGLEAYTATVENDVVKLTPVTEVPANTGVVLKGAAGTYNLTEISSSDTEQGSLQGSIAGATFYDESVDRYMLTLNGDDEAQFTKLGSGFITAGKSFLVYSGSGANNLRVVFGDESTGLSEELRVKSEEFAPVVYDLQGRRVAQAAKGLYIKNGKKVVIK